MTMKIYIACISEKVFFLLKFMFIIIKKSYYRFTEDVGQQHGNFYNEELVIKVECIHDEEKYIMSKGRL